MVLIRSLVAMLFVFPLFVGHALAQEYRLKTGDVILVEVL